jgi:hypothetical protein
MVGDCSCCVEAHEGRTCGFAVTFGGYDLRIQHSCEIVAFIVSWAAFYGMFGYVLLLISSSLLPSRSFSLPRLCTLANTQKRTLT